MKKMLALLALLPSLALAQPSLIACHLERVALSTLPILIEPLMYASTTVVSPMPGFSRSSVLYCTNAGVTCAAPSTATDGTNLADVGALTVVACADSGQTLSGAGSLQAYTYDPNTSLWSRVPDMDLATTTGSVRCLSFPSIYVPGPRGRVAWKPTGVTASSNSVTVYIYAFAPMTGSTPGKPM